jgi:galactoside O-acetyltransferase
MSKVKCLDCGAINPLSAGECHNCGSFRFDGTTLTTSEPDLWVERWEENLEAFYIMPGSKSILGVEFTTAPMQPLIPIDFYNTEEIRAMGIECGENCLLSKTTTVIAPEKLKLGHDVRIDGFSVISATGGITIGNHVHVASHVVLMGGGGIEVGNFASIASGAKVFSVSDDLMGRGLVGPCVPTEHRHVHKDKVVLEAHSVLAVNTVVVPGAKLSYGSTLLPFSVLVKGGHVHAGAVLQGVPAKVVKNKVEGFLDKARKADREGV